MRATLRPPLLLGVLVSVIVPAEFLQLPAAEPTRPSAVIVHDASIPQIAFAAADVRRSLQALKVTVAAAPLDRMSDVRESLRIVLAVANLPAVSERLKQDKAAAVEPLAEQGYEIRKTTHDGTTTYWLLGADPAGAMYAGMHLAEAVRIHQGLDAVRPTRQEPYLPRRGIKFNIPLDVRTPSYDDTGDAAQKNYVHMWDFGFWQKFLDRMARHRYNTLTLWNPHPFPSIVKCPNYPDVA